MDGGRTARISGEAADRPKAETTTRREPRVRRRLISPLTRRILTVNVIALAILVGGLLYLGEYEEGLVETELGSLTTQAEIFAAALAEGAVATGPDGSQTLRPANARTMLRRLVSPTSSRARLFTSEDGLVADSRMLRGPGGAIEVRALPPLEDDVPMTDRMGRWLDSLTSILSRRAELPVYRERAVQSPDDYQEIGRALDGEAARAVRRDERGGIVLSVAVPVQRFKKVVGVVLVTTYGEELDRALREVRLDILKMFGVALAVTVLLSIYLAGTIARPVRRLADAALNVQRGQGRGAEIPDFGARRDEIGDLSATLRDMTRSLWQRMDAIERFAADVAHEIKNPLTSLRSAVETASRLKDPEQQRQLMAIILEDVQRLDRLISDISDASRLDAELSRADLEPTDIGRLLQALVQVHDATIREGRPALSITVRDDAPLVVAGNEGRLVQVFQNLITNAFSFSPPDGVVRLAVRRENSNVVVTIDDDGPGIPEDSLESIFERFYSERPEGERFGTHSGLGLSISRQIVEAHGGAIRAQNRRDDAGRIAGARFTVRLPAA